MYRKGQANLQQEAPGQLQLVKAKANSDWLIKFDGRLKGHKGDL